MFARAFTAVFKHPSYVALSTTVALLVFAFAAWLPNVRLLFSILTASDISLADKLTFPLRLLESITTNFTTLSVTYAIAIALLTGINVALITYYVRRQKQQLSQAGIAASGLGILLGTVGIGCAACGSLILTSLLGTVGGAGLIAVLPLRGGEFGIVGAMLLLSATYLLAKQINKPLVCEPTNENP